MVIPPNYQEIQKEFFDSYGAKTKLVVKENMGHSPIVVGEPRSMMQYLAENINGTGVSAEHPLYSPDETGKYMNKHFAVILKFD